MKSISHIKMRLIPLLSIGFLSLTGSVGAAEGAPPAPAALVAGSTLDVSVLATATWIQGAAPETWEPDKVYVIECWATWCGPCIAQIPHLNELHKKYQDRGLRVIGMDVWEDGLEKVKAFVTKQADGMSYPIAYVGKGGTFETQWLKPAGASGIPFSLIVKNGALLATAHPSRLTDEVIENLLLPDGSGVAKAQESLKTQEVQADEFALGFRKFNASLTGGDIPLLESTLAELKERKPEFMYYPAMEVAIKIKKAEWHSASAQLDELAKEEILKRAVNLRHLLRVLQSGPPDEAFLNKYIALYEPLVQKYSVPMDLEALARIQWDRGDKAAAVDLIKKAAALCALPDMAQFKPFSTPYTRFAESLEKDVLPTQETFRSWISESKEALEATGSTR